MKMKFILSVGFLAISLVSFSSEIFFTCINEKGERMFSIKAYHAHGFSDGLAEVSQSVLEGTKSHYRWGFIDATGKMVIPCKYEEVYSFKSGVTWVKEPGADGFYLINKKGERLTTETWSDVGYFIENFCAVYDEEGKMGFVNREGKLVIPCKYTGDSFSEGLACVMDFNGVKANYGFIDSTGAAVIPFQFNQAGTSSFENGECRVQINGVTCLINKRGEVTFKPTLTKNCMGFYDGLSASYTKYETRSGWGYYNRNNVWVIQPQYDNAESFKGGLAVVEKGGKYGVIDTTGKIIIPIQYASVFGHAAEDGWFGVEMEANGDKQYLNAAGENFASVPVKYITGSSGVQEIMPYTAPDGKCGYLKKDGTVFLEAAYQRTTVFSEGKSWIWGNETSLPIAAGFSESNFAKEYVVGEKLKCQKGGLGDYVSVTLEQIGEHYYLVKYADGSQAWVVYNQLKR